MRLKIKLYLLTDERWWLLTTWQPLGVCCWMKPCAAVCEKMPAVATDCVFSVEHTDDWLFNIVVRTAHMFVKEIVMIGSFRLF
jgi:hypothetical protein